MSDRVIEENEQARRGMILRMAIGAVSDDGGTQTVDGTVLDGVERSGVEIYQQFGISSRPPAGALTLVFAVGGDPSDLVALPAGAPGARMGGLAPGETAMHGDDGSRVHIKAGGVIEIHAASKVTIFAPAGVDIVGDLRVTGQVSDANGTMQEMRDRYNGHGHPGGPPPSPQMT